MLTEYRGKWACDDWKIADFSHRCRRGTELDPEAAALEGQSLAGLGGGLRSCSQTCLHWQVGGQSFPLLKFRHMGRAPGLGVGTICPVLPAPRDDNPKRSGSHIVKSFEICHIFGEDED